MSEITPNWISDALIAVVVVVGFWILFFKWRKRGHFGHHNRSTNSAIKH